MKGRWSRVPSASSVWRISSGALTPRGRRGKVSRAVRSVEFVGSVQLASEFSGCQDTASIQTRIRHQPYVEEACSRRVPRIRAAAAWCAEERDLPDVLRDTPCAGGSGRKNTNVSGAEPTFFAISFVMKASPEITRGSRPCCSELKRPAVQSQTINVRGAVMASRQFLLRVSGERS